MLLIDWLIVSFSDFWKASLTEFSDLCDSNTSSVITIGGIMNGWVPNGHSTLNWHRMDVNIPLIYLKDELSAIFLDVILIIQNLTSLRDALFAVILTGEDSTFLMLLQWMENWHDFHVLILMCFWKIKFGGSFDNFFW